NNPKFQIFKSANNQQFYYRLKAKNGETILSGEGYTSKDSCLKGITSVMENAPIDNRCERKDATANYTFNLKAANGEIIGR
ncbi:YegP family protein, partial [Rhizobium leguminosarum]|uniref:YegP family protein n=1 Tax=Rhizobium leguminosarum TaxID=384 RepID=UPI003F974B46